MTAPALLCPTSGTLVDADATDGDGILRRRCDCGRVVATSDGPTAGLRVIERHGMFRTAIEAGATA